MKCVWGGVDSVFFYFVFIGWFLSVFALHFSCRIHESVLHVCCHRLGPPLDHAATRCIRPLRDGSDRCFRAIFCSVCQFVVVGMLPKQKTKRTRSRTVGSQWLHNSDILPSPPPFLPLSHTASFLSSGSSNSLHCSESNSQSGLFMEAAPQDCVDDIDSADCTYTTDGSWK